MAQAGQQRSPINAPTPIIVQNGIPNSPSVSILADGQVEFTNEDSNAYLLELWMKGNDKHVAVCVVLPANGTVTLQGDSSANDQNNTCHYNILTLTGGRTNPAAGGNYNIIIGSGVGAPHRA